MTVKGSEMYKSGSHVFRQTRAPERSIKFRHDYFKILLEEEITILNFISRNVGVLLRNKRLSSGAEKSIRMTIKRRRPSRHLAECKIVP
jgi:hypothetical protein